MAKDNFSAQSKEYAAFRPKLPGEVYDFVLRQVKHFDLAWDAGTGNGQTAVELAKVFKKVVATDISENQLSHAVQLPNIIYRKEPAEHSSLDDDSVDLVTIAQAIHWFDFDNFYSEVKRVTKPGGIIAAFTYTMFRVRDKTIDDVIQQFYAASSPYWDPERKYVDEAYKTIPFPFEEIAAPVFYINYEWNMGQLMGYMRTWSVNQHYRKQYGDDLVNETFKDALLKRWPSSEKISLQFPVFMRIGKAC